MSATLPSSDLVVDAGVENIIGRGDLGEVRLGLYRAVPVALKPLHQLRSDGATAEWRGGGFSPESRREALATLLRECEVLLGLHHPNLQPALGVIMDGPEEPLYFATPYAQAGTVRDLLHGEQHSARRGVSGVLPPREQSRILEGIFAALTYLAEAPIATEAKQGIRDRGILHRGVKPSNVLAILEGGALIKVMLIDFNEPKIIVLHAARAARGFAGVGSLAYMAPELRVERGPRSPKLDVFSAGVVAVEVDTGRLPNPLPDHRREGHRRVLVLEEERRAEDMSAIRGAEAQTIARRCIVHDPDKRADAAEILQQCHVWSSSLAGNMARPALSLSEDPWAEPVLDFQLAHVDHLLAVAWSPSGEQIATGGSEPTLRILSAANGAVHLEMPHCGCITSMDWSTFSGRLATAGHERRLRIIEPDTGEVLVEVAYGYEISSVAWSPSGQLIAVGSGDSRIWVVEASTGALAAELPHEGGARCLAWDPSGQLLAAAGGDSKLRVIAVATSTLRAEAGHSHSVTSVAWSPSGLLVAAGCHDGKLKIHEASSGVVRSEILHGGAVRCVSWSASGQLLATACGDGRLRVISASSWSVLADVVLDGPVEMVAWSPSGTALATVGADATLRVFRPK